MPVPAKVTRQPFLFETDCDILIHSLCKSRLKTVKQLEALVTPETGSDSENPSANFDSSDRLKFQAYS